MGYLPDSSDDRATDAEMIWNDLPIGLTLLSATDRLDELRNYLVTEITRMLKAGSVPLLMSALYRIDVPEARLVECLSHAPPDEIPGILAEMVLQRQLDKVSRRHAFEDAAGSPMPESRDHREQTSKSV